jgi:hypothetical protein
MVDLSFRLGVKVALIAIAEDSDDVWDREGRSFFLGTRITRCDAMVLTGMFAKATRVEVGAMAR